MLRYALLLGTLLFSVPGWGDPQSRSWSAWEREGQDVWLSYSIPAREVTRLPAYQQNQQLGQLLQAELERTVELRQGELDCESSGSEIERAREGFVRIRAGWSCSQADKAIDITLTTLMRQAPSHIHFARFQRNDGESFERLFTRRQASHRVYESGPTQQEDLPVSDTLLTYMQFGFEHILIGLDHIAFLLTLLLLATRLRDVIFIVTGFTLGHSLTLSLTVLGIVTPRLMVVEALIGFTIALVAVENITVRDGTHRQASTVLALVLCTLALVTAFAGMTPPVATLAGLALFSACYLRLSDSPDRARQLRPGITTLFGLIHGFGFASVLMEVGLPDSAVIPALVGFNVGVEIGQIAIVIILALLGRVFLRLVPGAGLAWQDLLSAALCTLGSYWFIQRLYF